MGFAELFLIAVSLSMDAFAVAVAKGLEIPRINYRHGAVIALFFGAFQAIMPLIGWLLGSRFLQYISKADHWIAFALLSFIGGKMIYEALREAGDSGSKDSSDSKFSVKELLVLSIATSIDALAAGISFAVLPDTSIVMSVILIGSTTFILSFIGVTVGNRFGAKYKSQAEIFGGVALVLIGTKILLEHLGVIAF